MKDKAFAMKTMGKYFRPTIIKVLGETYRNGDQKRFQRAALHSGHRRPSCFELEKTVPKAKTAKPEEFADSRLVKRLDQSGFIKSVLAGK